MLCLSRIIPTAVRPGCSLFDVGLAKRHWNHGSTQGVVLLCRSSRIVTSSHSQWCMRHMRRRHKPPTGTALRRGRCATCYIQITTLLQYLESKYLRSIPRSGPHALFSSSCHRTIYKSFSYWVVCSFSPFPTYLLIMKYFCSSSLRTNLE